jgi:hypothetical protein
VATGSSRSLFRGLPAEVGGIVRRQWRVALWPAALLGAVADVLVAVRHDLGGAIAVSLLLALLFELYVGYAELVVAADRRDDRRPVLRTLLRRAATVTPPLLLASAIAVSLPLAATGLLVLPGLYLLTRWSLFAPAIVHERLGVRESIQRSAALVRGAFWGVAATVTASLLIEHGVIHATVYAPGPVLASTIAAATATAIVSPPAAFTISVVYERLAASALEGEEVEAPRVEPDVEPVPDQVVP